jgi:hypothetical protein
LLNDVAVASFSRVQALQFGAIGVLAAVLVTGCSQSGEDVPAGFGPAAGATLAVVGVKYDAKLPLRSAPRIDEPAVAFLAPLESNLVATGRVRQVDSSRWFEVTVRGVTGWADSASLAYLGARADVTERVVDKLGRVPTAPSMLDLGRVVAAAATASTEPPGSQVIVTAAPATVGDVSEVTYDVVGYPDDSVLGERVQVLGTPGQTFTLDKVEATTLCRRGVTGDRTYLCL